jgi:hypothetical protein
MRRSFAGLNLLAESKFVNQHLHSCPRWPIEGAGGAEISQRGFIAAKPSRKLV